jgi:ankyrin repeat protein
MHIADQLNALAAVVKTRSRASLTDANHILETIAARFLNALFGWDLSNLNFGQANYPAADLGDRHLRIAIQVTNQADSGKIKDTTDKAQEHNLKSDFDRLVILFLLPKKPGFPKNFRQPPGGPRIETWDIADLLKQLQVPSFDLGALARASDVLDEEMGTLSTEILPSRALPPGLDATYASLLVQIQSGNADHVRAMLKAGLSPNTLLDGKTPLFVALEQFAASPVASIPPADDPRFAVVASLLQSREMPRDIARQCHAAFDCGILVRVLALRRAGTPLEVRDESGRSLIVKAMRRDDEILEAGSREEAESVWVRPLLRDGVPQDRVLATWVFFWASRRGLVDVVKQIVSNGHPVNCRLDGVPGELVNESELCYWRPATTPLHLAARSHAGKSIVGWLLTQGADPNVQDADGNTPLMNAVSNRQVETLRLLITKADPGITNLAGQTALYFGIGEPEIVRLLLDAKAKPDGEAVHRAVDEFDHASLAVLLDGNADVDVLNAHGRSPLMEMSCFWDRTILDLSKPDRFRCFHMLVQRGADVRSRGRDGRTVLHWLAQAGDLNALRVVIDKQPDINASDDSGRTPLMLCLDGQAAELLLNHGAQLELHDRWGHTARDWADMFSRDQVAEVLRSAGGSNGNVNDARVIRASLTDDASGLGEAIEAGGDPDARDGWGETALHCAAGQGNAEAVRVLVSLGADINWRDEDGSTALAAALRTSCDVWEKLEQFEETVEVLLDAGASIHAVDGRGDSAAQAGNWSWHATALGVRLLDACLEDVNDNGETVLMTAVERGNVDQVSYVLRQNKVDINGLDYRGRNALFRFATYSKDAMGIAQLLVDQGIDVNCGDESGITPLMAAANSGKPEFVRLLVKYGADTARVDDVGRTARRCAMNIGDAEMAELLLECERNQSRNSDGERI